MLGYLPETKESNQGELRKERIEQSCYILVMSPSVDSLLPKKMHSIRELLRLFVGHGKKETSPFSSEKEAFEFCKRVYEQTQGVPPELRRAYEFYKKNIDDDCPPTGGL